MEEVPGDRRPSKEGIPTDDDAAWVGSVDRLFAGGFPNGSSGPIHEMSVCTPRDRLSIISGRGRVRGLEGLVPDSV